MSVAPGLSTGSVATWYTRFIDASIARKASVSIRLSGATGRANWPGKRTSTSGSAQRIMATSARPQVVSWSEHGHRKSRKVSPRNCVRTGRDACVSQHLMGVSLATSTERPRERPARPPCTDWLFRSGRWPAPESVERDHQSVSRQPRIVRPAAAARSPPGRPRSRAVSRQAAGASARRPSVSASIARSKWPTFAYARPSRKCESGAAASSSIAFCAATTARSYWRASRWMYGRMRSRPSKRGRTRDVAAWLVQ